MTTAAYIMLAIGGLFFVISFFLPDGKKKEDERITKEEIKALIDREMENAKVRIDDMVEETVNYSVEKTERALERLSNEKIMAVDEYSETVLKTINDNHQEAVFLYDMLNNKDEKLKNQGDELKAVSETIRKEQQALQEKQEEAKRIEEEKAALLKEQEEQEKKRLEEEQKVQERRHLEEERLRLEKEQKEKELKEKEQREKALQAQKEAENSKAPEEKKEEEFQPLVLEHFAVENDKVVPVAKPKTTKGTKAKSSAKNASRIENADEDNKAGEGYSAKLNNNELIVKLHNEGKSNTAIAKELGLGVGEVKLVIDLFSRKK